MNTTITTKKQAVKNFVNNATGLNLAVNSKSVELFYYYLIVDNEHVLFDFKYRPVYTTGSGKWTKTSNVTSEICKTLDLMGIPYELGNDAPKGGKMGNYILISAADRVAVTNQFNQI